MRKPKSNSVVTYALSEDESEIKFTVVGAGETFVTVDGKPKFGNVDMVLHLARVSQINDKRANIQGYVSKVSDGTSVMREDPVTKKIRTPREMALLKAEGMQRVVDHLNSGSEDWSPPRVTVGEILDPVLLAAVAEVKGWGVEKVRELVRSQSEKRGVAPKVFLEALGTNEQVKEVATRLKAERTGLDGDELLEGLMDDGEETN